MKRKLFTFLFAFLATLSGAVWGQTTINLSSLESGTGVSVSGTTITINQPGDYVITGSTTMYHVNIDTRGHTNVLLQDVSINLNTSDASHKPISVWPNTTVDFTIVGENTISVEGNNQAAISVWNGASITIKGTGILRAEGYCGIGYPDGACGDITIESGTVVANGSTWCIGGAQSATTGNEPTLNMTGDALLVVYDESTNRDKGIYNMNYWGLESHPDHGIYCNAKAQADFGSLYSDVTLQSPFPSDDFVVDLNSHTLTLGEGSYARINQITGLDGSGKLNAYKVIYEDNLDEAWGVNPTNSLPETLYYGAGYKVASWDAGIAPKVTSDDQKNNATYKQVPGKWWNGTGWVAANTVPYTSAASGIVEVNYGAAWYLAEFNPTYSDTEGFQGRRTFWIPANANFEWNDANNPKSLAEAGLQIDANQIKGLSTPISGGEYEINLTFENPTNDPALTCKINATVTSSALNVGDGTKVNVELLKKSGEYKGSISTTSGYSSVEIIKVSCMYSEGTWTEVTTDYTVRYQKDGEVDWHILSGKLQEVGTYKIKVVGMGNMLTGEKEVGTFTITPKAVTIQAELVTIKAGESETVEGQFSFVSGVIEGESEYLTIKANPLDVNNYSEAGEYNVTYTGISLEPKEPYSQLHKNYSVTSTIEGKLIVTANEDESYDLSNEEEVKVTFPTEITYNGESINKPAVLADLKVLYGKDQKPANADEYEVSFSLKEGGADWTADPKDVAEYKIKVTGKGKLLTGERILEFSIIQKYLNVSAEDLYWYQGESANQEGEFTIDGVCDADKGKVAVSGSVDVSNLSFGWNSDVEYMNAQLTGDRAFNYYCGSVKGDVWKQAPAPTKPDVKPDGGNWIWSDQLNGFVKVYDGISYSLEKLHVVFEDGSEKDMELGIDYSINLQDPIIKDANNYEVVVKFTNSSYADAKVLFVVTKRPMIVNLKKFDKSTIDQTLNAVEWVESYEDAVSGEIPSIKGTIKVAPRPVNGVYNVVFEGLALVDNLQENFKANNYTATWMYNGDVIDLDGEGDGEIGTNIDTGDQGGEGGQQPSKDFCNIYVVEESSPYIQLNPSRKVVEAIGKITVDVVIPDEIEMDDVKLTFRRGNGEWETLTIDEVTKKYTIKDINTHIYLKAEVDAALLDAEPNENHVYIDLSCTKDGIKLDAEREIVENGEDVLIWSEVSKEIQNKVIKYEYKVTRFGEWKELKATANAGEFIIRNVTNDVFVRAYLSDQTKDPETTKEAVHHVYSDLSVTCKGLYLDADRKLVANNGSTKVYLTIEPNYSIKNAHYMFRRGIHEAWEELTPSTESNVFVVTGIESDIYLKAVDAVSTGMEDIDGAARVYAKDGSLYVYTAQPEEISVISMTGVTVKRTQQTGLQSYPLNQGIYVVLVGEQVFKVRVK